MKVSVVTPAYNAAKYLPITLQSVLLQDYPDIEHIVVDDGSTDKTRDILTEYETKYNLRWISKENEGQAIAVNTGFELADGDIVIWLNSDDVLFTRNTISKIVSRFRTKHTDLVYGHMAIIDEMNYLKKVQFAPSTLNYSILSLGHLAACISYRTEIALKYRLNPSLRYAIDYDQCLRMAKDQVRFNFLDSILLGWRRHSTAKSVVGEVLMKNEVEVVRKHYSVGRRIPLFLLRFPLYGDLLMKRFSKFASFMNLLFSGNSPEFAFPIKFSSTMKSFLTYIIPYT